MAVKLNQHDLQFILKQIKIAEAHASGIPLNEIRVDADGNYGTVGQLAISQPHLPYGLRTVDGTYNNIIPGRELWGAADQTMPRMFDPNWRNDADGDSYDVNGQAPGGVVNTGNYDSGDTNGDPNDGEGNIADADPRIISNLIVDQSPNNPAALIAALRYAGHEGDLTAKMASVMEPFALLHAAHIANGRVASWQKSLTDIDAAIAAALAKVPPDMATAGQLQGIRPTIENGLNTATAAAIAPNDAAVGAQAALDAAATELGIEFEVDGRSLKLPNVAPDEGLSAPFNGWMTFFGQFFDHGLDLISKGGDGTIYVPLQPDDPLYVPGGFTNFMVLTRATQVAGPGADGVLGTADDTAREAINVTTPFVDQNQTYTSHPSHQVFLREYEIDEITGKTAATGRLLDGDNGGLPTWKDVKENALEFLGIQLTDRDVFNIPLIRTDLYGKFIPDPVTGYAQVIMDIGYDGIPNTADDIVASGTPSDPVILNPALPGGAEPVRTSHSFLDDIAHNAVPVLSTQGTLITDGNDVAGVDPAGNAVQFNPLNGRNTEYDNELLDAHFVTGDGRGNENIGLTAVHHVFHSEHNRQVAVNQLEILKTKDLEFINEWLLTDLTQDQVNAIPSGGVDLANYAKTLDWDGERLFQTARFATEMQYQHLVFEEFGRKIQPMIDVFVFNTITDIDPAIFAEFAHVVYRFGHSMLTEEIKRLFLDGDGNPIRYDESGAAVELEPGDLGDWGQDVGLIEAFLNPIEFDMDGTISHDQAAGAIFRGMTLVRGNEIDEFVVDALRTNLLGLPLDLAAINIARGRDTGMPTLNEARGQLYDASNSSFVKPYESWSEFAANLKNPASVINFIAAYGKHSSLTEKVTDPAFVTAANPTGLRDKNVEELRAAATLLVLGGAGAPADRLAFLNGTNGTSLGGADWSTLETGLNDIDLWIGGLAEKKMPFGGMLGSTFNAVFEAQLEMLQDLDRFYYLTRTQGLNLLNELENNAFAKMIAINSDMVDPGPDGIRGTEDDVESPFRTGVDSFAKHDFVLNVDLDNQIEEDPTHDDAHLNAIGMTKVQRDNLLTVGPDENYIRFIGGEHVVIGGSEGNDTIVSDFGDDAIWGGGGDDRIESGAGVDFVIGGAGNDIITDSGDTGDFIKGEDGDDIIANSNGLDILMGGDGKDVFFVGVDGTEVFAGEGDDFILGGADHDFILGNEGDDWMEGGDGFDVLNGENSELFFNSTIIGHDVMIAGENENDFDAESGDDIMVQGESVMRNEGMYGFDWAIHKGNRVAADSDMRIPIFTTVADDILRDRFDQTEALSGWIHNDVLRGDDRGSQEEIETELDMTNHELSWAGVDRIDGLEELLGGLLAPRPTDPSADLEKAVAFKSGNVLIGGDGNDTFEGRGGDDFIHGDAWLNVRIRITAPVLDALTGKVVGVLPNDADGANEIATVDTLKHVFTQEQIDGWVADLGTSPDAGLVAHMNSWVGKSMYDLMMARTIVPAQMHIQREILYDENPSDNVDTAIFAGNKDWYEITEFEDGSVRVARREMEEVDPQIDEGTDTLVGIERIQFADQTVVLQQSGNHEPVGRLEIIGLPAKEGETLTISAMGVYDANNPGEVGSGNVGHMTFRWQIERNDGTGDYINIPGAFGNTFTPGDEHTGLRIRVVGTYVDAGGVTETVMSLPTDLVIGTNDQPMGELLISDMSPTEGQTLTMTVAFNDADGITDAFEEGLIAYQWQWANSSTATTWNDVVGATGLTWSIPTTGSGAGDFGGRYIRAQVTYTDDLGNEHIVHSAVTEVVGEYMNLDGGSNTQNGSAGGDLINGNNGNDVLGGLAGHDILNGGNGNDTLNGGDGNDTLDGGSNSNTAGGFEDEFNTSSLSNTDGSLTWSAPWVESGDNGNTNSASAGQIRIDSGANTPTNALVFRDDDSDTGNGTASIQRTINLAGATSATISYDYDENNFDADEVVTVEFSPNGAAPWQLIQTINSNSGQDSIENVVLTGTFTANAVIRFTVSGTNNSGVSGGVIDNVAIDNLVINAVFPGIDTVNGGAGDDILIYQNGDGNHSLDGGADNDTLRVLGADGSVADTMTVILSGGSITAVHGSNGSAQLASIEHANMDLGEGIDTLSYAGNTVAIEADLLTGAATGFSYIRNIENVTGGSGNDTIHGDNLANVLNGGLGSDTVRGGFGDDSIAGGDGDDFLYGDEEDDVINGGLGNDRIDGGEGNDTASYAGSAVAVTVTLAQTATTVAGAAETNVGKDLFVSIENLLGSSHNDTLTGNGEANVIDGGAGADAMIGGAGDDTYVIDDTTAEGGVDTVTEADGGGIDTVRSALAINLATGAGFLNQEIENIVLTGSGSVIATGNGENNRLTGNSGSNTLDGGIGDDTVVLASTHEAYTFGLSGGNVTVSGGGSATDTLIGIENAEIAGVSYNIVPGTTGNDAGVNGGSEADLVLGFSGNDVLNAGDGNDILKGGDGNDTLNGGAGNDILDGGASGGSSGTFEDNFNGTASYTDNNGTLSFAGGWTETGDVVPPPPSVNIVTGGQIRISGSALVFGDNDNDAGNGGAAIQRTLNLAGRSSASISFDYDENSFDAGEIVRVEFSPNGLAPWQLIEEIDGSSGEGSVEDAPLNGPLTANAVIRVTVSGTNNNSGSDTVVIDNLVITATTAGGDTMTGGDGDDTYYVDGTSGINIDQVVEGNGANSGIDTVVLTATGSYTLAANVEKLVVQSSGNRTLTGNAGDNEITGGSGNDRIDGAGGTDTVVYANPVTSYTIGTNGAGEITINGGAGVGTDTLVRIEKVRFADQIVTINTQATAGDDDITIVGAEGQIILGGDGNDNIVGGNGHDIIIGGEGDDTLFGSDVGTAGDNATTGADDNDTFIWNVDNDGDDGVDTINGGFEGAGGDTFVVSSTVGGTETFGIYTFDEAVALLGYAGDDEVEIIVTRHTSGGEPDADDIVAELTDIEEIVINGGGGTNNVEFFGDFSLTSLRPNTVTIIGGSGDDTVDLTSLLSAHRVVFKTGGGNDVIIGALRPQDVIELPDGTTIADYEVTIDEDGLTALAGDGHSITFFAPQGMPGFGTDHDEDDDEDEDIDNTPPAGSGDPSDDDDEDEQDEDDDEDEDEDDLHEEDDDDDDTGIVTPGSVTGTPTADVFIGTAASDAITAFGGADVLRGMDGDDFLSGGEGRDMVFGGAGNDDMMGGSGADMLYGDAGSDRIFGDEGDDLIDAGAGNDTVQGGAGSDIIVAATSDGNDTYYGDGMSASCGDGTDTLDMAAITANITADLGTGFSGRGSASSSQSGTDTLWGIENIVTGSGNDTITASSAVNVIDGGAGNDTFRFLSAADANGDTILGFQPGDRIDLSGIDANTTSAGHQFTLVTGTGFNAAGTLRVTHQTSQGQDYTLMEGNTNGGSDAEFTIKIKGNHTLTANDFEL